MGKELLLRSQMKEVADAIRALGFDPVQFHWDEVESAADSDTEVHRLTFVSEPPYMFQFDRGRNGHLAVYSPGREQAVDTYGVGEWGYQLQKVVEWLGYLRREIETPDPMVDFFQAADLVREGEDQTAGNAPFSDAEVREFVRRLEVIRGFLLQRAGEDTDARSRIEEKIDFLVTKARTSGRRDWFFMAMGVLMTEIVSRGLDSEQIRQVIGLLVHGVQRLTGG